MAATWGTTWRRDEVRVGPRLSRSQPRLWIALFCVSTSPMFLGGCLGVPDNAVKLSAIQIQHLEQYRTSVQSVLDSCRANAQTLIAERNLGYDRLLQRGEDLRKEFYRLTSHLLSRIPIPGNSPRFQESLIENDRRVIQQMEEYVNRRIERYLAASTPVQIDKAALLRAKQTNDEAEIRRILGQMPSGTLKNDIQNSLSSAEPFDTVRPVLEKRIDELNVKLRAGNEDIGRLGKDVELLVGRIDKLETALDGFRAAQSDYRQKASKAMGELNARLKELESAGDTVVATQKNLHAVLQRVGSVSVQAGDILTNIHPLIDSLGTAGVIKDEEANAITEILNSFNELLRNGETKNG